MLVHVVPNYEDIVPTTKSVRAVYTIADKLDMLNKALAIGSMSKASTILGVPKTTLRGWRKQRAKLELRAKELRKHKRTKAYRLKGNKKPLFGPLIEESLLEYYRGRRACKLVVTIGILVAYWRGIDEENVDKISPSARRFRMQRFMERNGLSWRKKTHKAQQNRRDVTVIKDFVEYVLWKKQMLGITDDRAIVNADETNVYFSPSFE